MIYLSEFDITDFDRMELKPDSWAQRSNRPMIEIYAANGPAATLWDDEKVIMCGGVACGLWKGFGEFWLVPSVHVGRYPKAVFQTARDYINDTIDKLELHRVQAAVETKHIRWIEKLGFEREGLMRKFGPNQEDKFLYARVK